MRRWRMRTNAAKVLHGFDAEVRGRKEKNREREREMGGTRVRACGDTPPPGEMGGRNISTTCIQGIY